MKIRRFRNLYPDDPVFRFERSKLEFKDGKWVEVESHRKAKVRSATGRYIFVTVGDEIFVCRASWRMEGRRVSHIDLAHGRTVHRAGTVHYAGEVYFANRKKRGIMRKWNNASGHYKPSPKYAHQAKLPIEYFLPQAFPSLAQSGYIEGLHTLLL